MMLFLSSLLLVLIGVRILFFVKAVRSSSVDEYFWIQYRANARRCSVFPPVLPQYLLDLRQWYLPLFGLLLKSLPDALFGKRYLLTVLLSIVRLCLIVVYCYLIDYPELELVLVIVLIYIITPAYVTYDNQLNSRILGSIIFDLTIFSLYQYHTDNSLAYLFVFSGLCGILIYLHKLTFQLLIFILVMIVVVYGSVLPITAFLAVLSLSLFLGYKKHLVAHYESTLFWVRNRANIGQHQIEGSPIYGAEQAVGNSVFGEIKGMLAIIGLCPFVVFYLMHYNSGSFFEYTIIVTYVAAVLTTIVPAFKGWGLGRSYIYYVPPQIALFLTDVGFEFKSSIHVGVLFLCLAGVAYTLSKYSVWLERKIKDKDESFEEALHMLTDSNLNRIMCIPITISDEVAFKACKTVAWGGHGYGYKLLEPYFPILKVKIEDAVKDWNLGAVLVDKEYWPDYSNRIDAKILDKIYENPRYVILRVVEWEDAPVFPAWAKHAYPGLLPDWQRLSKGHIKGKR